MSSQSVATTPDVREGDRRRWLILSVLVVAQFMVVLDVAIVNVALPTIKNDLHFSEKPRTTTKNGDAARARRARVASAASPGVAHLAEKHRT